MDISSPGSHSGFNSIPGFPSPNDDDSMPDMLSALLGGQGGANGLGGANGFPAQFAQMLGGGPGSTPVHIEPPRKKTWTDRLLPLIHLLGMVFLAFYAVFILEPSLRQGHSTLMSGFGVRNPFEKKIVFGGNSSVDWYTWAALGKGKKAGPDSDLFAKAIEMVWEGSGHGIASLVNRSSSPINECKLSLFAATFIPFSDLRAHATRNRNSCF